MKSTSMRNDTEATSYPESIPNVPQGRGLQFSNPPGDEDHGPLISTTPRPVEAQNPCQGKGMKSSRRKGTSGTPPGGRAFFHTMLDTAKQYHRTCCISPPCAGAGHGTRGDEGVPCCRPPTVPSKIGLQENLAGRDECGHWISSRAIRSGGLQVQWRATPPRLLARTRQGASR